MVANLRSIKVSNAIITQAPFVPVYTYLFNAPLESANTPPTVSYDNVGNWIYELGSNYPGLTVDSSEGCPVSPIASLNNSLRRFYIQAADNAPPINGTSILTTSANLDATDWIYSIYFYSPSVGTTDINLGGFNPGGGPGQAIFSLIYYYNTPYLEARINDNSGAYYLGNDLNSFTFDTWHQAEIRKTGTTVALYLDNVQIATSTYSGTFLPANLVSFGVNRSENGARTGWVDQVQLYYI